MNEMSLHKIHRSNIQPNCIRRRLKSLGHLIALLGIAVSLQAQQGRLLLPGGLQLLRLPPIQLPSDPRPGPAKPLEVPEDPVRQQSGSNPSASVQLGQPGGGGDVDRGGGNRDVTELRDESGGRSAESRSRPRTEKHRRIMKTIGTPLPGLRKLQAQTRIRVAVEADINPATVEPGDRVYFKVETGESDFGSLGSMASMPTGAEVEGIVLKIRRPEGRDKGGVVFQPAYLVWPDGPEEEVAVPIAAMLLKPSVVGDESPHEVGSKATTIASAFGQLTFGINGYFTAGALATLAGTKLSQMQQDVPSYCIGVLKEGTLGDIVLTKTRYF